MKAFSIIGLHNSGKTTAVEGLINYLKSKNISVSSIKDIHQADFTMEKKGSNTQRHLQASNTYVFARGINETHLIWNRQLPFKEMIKHITTEWLIIEGMKELPLPKIISAKTREEIDTLFDDTVFAITGPYSEKKTDYRGIPVINSIIDINRLGELTIEKVFDLLPFANEGYCNHCGYNCLEMTKMILKGQKTRNDCGLKKNVNLKIYFDETEIPLNDWTEKLTTDLITSICENLKGYKKGANIKILIK